MTKDMRLAKIERLTETILKSLAPWEVNEMSRDEIERGLTDDPLIVVEWLVERFIDEI